MKKITLMIVIILIFCSCATKKNSIIDDNPNIVKEVDEIKLIIDSISIEEKIGQLFIVRPESLMKDKKYNKNFNSDTVNNDLLSIDRIDESLYRILSNKKKYGLNLKK